MRNDLGGRKKITVNSKNLIPIGCVKQLDDVTLKLDLQTKSGGNFDVTGQTLSLRCRKSNNKTEELSNTSTDTPITFNKNEVDIKLRNSMFNTVGVVKFELNIQDSTGAMTTASFFITVVALELDDDAVTSSEQYSVLQELINNFDSSPIGEVVAARNGHATLGGRLDGVDSQLDTKVSIDVNRFVTSRHFNLYSKLMNFVLVNGCVLGDSIAEGGSGSWHRLLTEKLIQDGYNVGGFREHGVGGTTALNILQAVSYDAIQMANTNSNFIEHRKGYPYNYDYWLICSGRNDSSGKVDLKTYEKILRATLRTAKRNQIDVILIIEPPAIDMITGEIIDGYVSGDVNQYETYSELARKIGNSEGVSIVDMQKYFKFKSLTESLIPYYADGVHYSTLGQQEMMKMVYECLTRTPEEGFKPNYFKIPQANYYPISAFTPSRGTYTYETYTPISSVSRLWHLQDKDASADKYIKVINGNSVTFEFLNNKLDFISVNFLRKLTTGTIKITSGGVTVASGLRGMNNNMAEDSVYALCTRTDFPARGSVTITAENGDLAITGVSTLQPILTTRHKEFNGIIQGTPSDMPISGITFKNLYTVGDCFEFEWIGNNVGINIAKGPEMGIVDITTDGVTETVDLYQRNYAIWNIYSLLKNLEYGKHKTRITVKDKNGSSNGRNTPIREIHVYSSSSSDGSIATLINNKSDVYLTNVYNLINLENYLLTTNPNMTGWSKVDNKILTIESETMKILETKLK